MRFLLDEHFSENVARALDMSDYPVVSVKDVIELGRGSSDRAIATWCGQRDHVWVTVDRDARSREMRLSILPAFGTKVILLSRDPKGRREQLAWIISRFDEWEFEAKRAEGYAAWLQRRRGRPKKLTR